MRALRWAWGIGFAGALVACRGILGIDALELDDGATGADGGGADAAAEASAADGGGGSADAGPAYPQCVAQGGACRKCCHDDVPGLGEEFERLMNHAKPGCLCGQQGECKEECGAAFCGGGAAPLGGCPPCVDDIFTRNDLAGPCKDAADACNGDPTCKPMLDCLSACPP